jgi:hypothetical protein
MFRDGGLSPNYKLCGTCRFWTGSSRAWNQSSGYVEWVKSEKAACAGMYADSNEFNRMRQGSDHPCSDWQAWRT